MKDFVGQSARASVAVESCQDRRQFLGTAAARLYRDTTRISTGGGFFDVRGVKIPVAVSVFPEEIHAAPRSWAERAYPKLIYYNKLDRGSHFAAWEQPALFSSEICISIAPPIDLTGARRLGRASLQKPRRTS
jgi:hypothetical protein